MRGSTASTKGHGEKLLDLMGNFIGASPAQVVRRPGVLEVRDGTQLTCVTAETPAVMKTGSGTVLTVLRVQAAVPADLEPALDTPGALGVFNRFATLAAATRKDGKLFIGSRLTVFEEDESFVELHGPLMVGATLLGATSIFRGMGALMSGKEPSTEPCAWTLGDFQAAQRSLRRFCICTADAGGMTAELSTAPGSGLMIAGDTNTAHWEMVTWPAHPEEGSGLLCGLEMPQRFATQEALYDAIDALNSAEMDAIEAPPHLGACCVGLKGLELVYVTFVPNFLREAIDRLPMHLTLWASARGAWARAELERLGTAG